MPRCVLGDQNCCASHPASPEFEISGLSIGSVKEALSASRDPTVRSYDHVSTESATGASKTRHLVTQKRPRVSELLTMKVGQRGSSKSSITYVMTNFLMIPAWGRSLSSRVGLGICPSCALASAIDIDHGKPTRFLCRVRACLDQRTQAGRP